MSAEEETATDERCPPCRGTGEVISRLGGEPSTEQCPWCGGSGVLPRAAPPGKSS